MTVKDVQERIHRILVDRFGTVRVGRSGEVWLENETAIGRVDVMELGDDIPVVKIGSPMLRDVKLTPDVYKWVAIDGQCQWFAHARIIINSDSPDLGMILWEYDLLGNFLDPEELLACVDAVMVGSNRFDDELQARFGGTKGRN